MALKPLANMGHELAEVLATLVYTRPGAKGELKATLCFILPEEKMFSSYYGITCQAR